MRSSERDETTDPLMKASEKSRSWREFRHNRSVQLIYTGFWLGSVVFGGLWGAYARLKELSLRENWALEEEVDGIYAIAFFLPGIPYLNFWGALCTRIARFATGLMALAGLLLPSLALVLIMPSLQNLEFIKLHRDSIGKGMLWFRDCVREYGTQEVIDEFHGLLG